MLRRMIWLTILAAPLAGLIAASAEPLVRRETSIHAFEMDAVVTDRQGVRTELTAFGRLFGTDALAAHHGDADIQIPFERIRSFKVGMMVDSRAPVQLELADGSRMQVEIDTHEYTTTFTGNASFGSFRIVLGKIASCRLALPQEEEEPIVSACPRGHRWAHPDYRFCPYDGEPLEEIVRKTLDQLKEDK